MSTDNDITVTLAQYSDVTGFDFAFNDGFRNAHPVPANVRERLRREATLEAFREALVAARAEALTTADNEFSHVKVFERYQRTACEFYEQGLARWIIEQGLKPEPKTEPLTMYRSLAEQIALTRENMLAEAMKKSAIAEYATKRISPMIGELVYGKLVFRRYNPRGRGE